VRRQQRPWINAARRLKRGDEPLPKPQVEGAVPPGQRLRLALLAVGGLLLLGGMAAAFVAFTGVLSWARVADLAEREMKLREQLGALDRDPGAARAATGELDQDTVTAYLALRRRLDPTARAYAAQLTYPAAGRSDEKEDHEGVMPADAMRLHERRTAARIAVLSEAVAALRQQHFSSAAFSELLTTVEWRCLKRPQARLLSIAPHFRGEWQAAKAMLAAQEQNEQLLAERGGRQAAGGPAPANDPAAARSGLREAAAQDDAAGAAGESAATDAERVQAAVDTWKEQVARTRADAEARIRDMERLADAAPPLSAAAQQVCEANRTALQEPAAEATVALACALDPQLNCF